MDFLNLPRVKLANLPTPLQELPRLTEALNGPRIYIKRDDLTGLALGGNKTRKLEYLMGDAVRQKADYIVTGAGFHSNWCTQTAAAARKLGMKVALVKFGPKDGYDPEDYDGNHLLHFLSGAEIQVVRPEHTQKVEEETMEKLKAAGHRPYRMVDAGSMPLGVAGHVNCLLELMGQIVDRGLKVDYLVHTSGSGGTQAGLIIGAKAFNTTIKVIGSTTGSRSRENSTANIGNLIGESLKCLGFDLKITEEDIVVYDQYAGEGYGFMTEAKAEAIKIMAETEGIFLDPVYTSSSMACLIDLCRKGFFKREEVVVFLHTGGIAGLFPYKAPLKAYGSGKAFPWTIPPWSPAAAET
ncbi:MAG: D-cysteine desulfhydrase family protein [Proteobacteria bacterium]|nr:D-cysteine desulfhydrase family protein [Pseudomonadota bacterium]